MKVAVVIVNFKTPLMSVDSAAAAINELSDSSYDWGVVIVDNDSGDGSYETIADALSSKREQNASWEKVEVIASPNNGGFGSGNNFGIRHFLQRCAPEYFYILNSDAFPQHASISALISTLDESDVTGIAGSYIYGTDDAPHTTAFRFPTIQSEFEGALRLGLVTRWLRNYVVPLGIPSQSMEVDWLAGASMMIKRTALEQAGMFDETFFLYFEETELCFRLKQAGYKTVYVKESRVKHIGSASTGMNKWHRTPSYWFDSRRHYFRKCHGNIYYGLATLSLVAGEIGWKCRVLVERKRDFPPARRVTDLLRHFFGCL